VQQVVAHLEGAGATWPIDKDAITIGRDGGCHVTLSDQWASGVHAEITLHNGQHFIRDMGSGAGTWINGMPLGMAHRLEGGDTIHIGQTSLRYVKVGQALGAPKGPAPRERRVPMLEVRRGPGVGLRFALDRDSITVGRDPQSGLRLDDVQVSRRHAVLSNRGGTWYVCDLHSSRGTFKNRAQLRPGEEVPIAEGDTVQFGDSMLVFIGA
jgi:pSer/pThr/pTyr-binding forkhead associated (FHA) protein